MKLPHLHVGSGTQCGPATIFPVWADSPKTTGLVTGSNAQLLVQEMPAPAVDSLTVTNMGLKAALITEGQMLEGGQQDRIAAQTTLIGASETAVLNVLCVEQGRWSGGSEHRNSGRRAPLHVHAGLHGRGTNRQEDVWRRVHHYTEIGASSSTGSLLHHMDQPLTREMTLPNIIEGQRGVIIGFDGKVVMLELFGSHKLFRSHYRALMESMLLDLLLLQRTAGQSAPVVVRAQTARDFIVAMATNGFTSVDHGEHRSSRRTLPASRFEGSHPDLPVKGVSMGGADGTESRIAHLIAWNRRHSMLS